MNSKSIRSIVEENTQERPPNRHWLIPLSEYGFLRAGTTRGLEK